MRPQAEPARTAKDYGAGRDPHRILTSTSCLPPVPLATLRESRIAAWFAAATLSCNVAGIRTTGPSGPEIALVAVEPCFAAALEPARITEHRQRRQIPRCLANGGEPLGSLGIQAARRIRKDDLAGDA